MRFGNFGYFWGLTSELPIFVLGGPSDQMFWGYRLDAGAEPMYRQISEYPPPVVKIKLAVENELQMLLQSSKPCLNNNLDLKTYFEKDTYDSYDHIITFSPRETLGS